MLLDAAHWRIVFISGESLRREFFMYSVTISKSMGRCLFVLVSLVFLLCHELLSDSRVPTKSNPDT